MEKLNLMTKAKDMFQQNKFVIFVVALFFVGAVYLVVSESDNNLISAVQPVNPMCPDDYSNSEDQMKGMNDWINQFFDDNPDASMEDLGNARYQFLQDNNCVEAIQRWKDAENGNADPETMEIIDEVLEEYQ